MILIWSTQSPIGNPLARETLETALAYAAYDQEVALLFSGLAVHQLKTLPNALEAGSKDISKLVKALPVYDVESLYVCSDSLTQTGLNTEQLIVQTTRLTKEQITALIQGADHVLRV